MSTPTRIYMVANKDNVTGHPRLVRAPNSAQAVRHVSADTLAVVVASQEDLVQLVAAGVKVESCGESLAEPTN